MTIRSNDQEKCPFGLSISCACSNVGPLVNKMAPIEIMGPESSDEEKKEIASANNHLFLWNNINQQCPYAATLFKEKTKFVECSWDPETSGVAHGALMGSPFYYKHFSGVNTDGVNYNAAPLGYYVDAPIDKSLYGLYSIEGIF